MNIITILSQYMAEGPKKVACTIFAYKCKKKYIPKQPFKVLSTIYKFYLVTGK